MRVKGTPRGKRKALFLYVTAFMLGDGGGGCCGKVQLVAQVSGLHRDKF